VDKRIRIEGFVPSSFSEEKEAKTKSTLLFLKKKKQKDFLSYV